MIKQLKVFWLNNLVVRNFFYLTTGSVVSQLFGLFAILKIANLFDPSSYGFFTFLTIQGQLLITLADLGTRNIIIRKIARDKCATKDVFVNGLILRAIMVLLVVLCYSTYNSFMGVFTYYQIGLLFLFTAFNTVFNLIESIFWLSLIHI